MDQETLNKIEKDVDSLHLAQSSTGDGVAPNAGQASSGPDIDALRKAAEEAAAESSEQRLEPVAALGAQPLDENVQKPSQAPLPSQAPPTVEPQNGSMPQPLAMPTPQPSVPGATPPMPAQPAPQQPSLPQNLVPDRGLPPEQTGVNGPPSPPPVPPPFTPQSLPTNPAIPPTPPSQNQ